MAAKDEDGGHVALLSATALGDGLLALVLAENLRRAGRTSALYHTQLVELGGWFPDDEIRPLPDGAARDEVLRSAAAVFVGDERLLGGTDESAPPGAQRRLVFGKRHWRRDEPYLRSLAAAAGGRLDLAWTTDRNGLRAPEEAAGAAHRTRVCLLPSSGSPNKNWPAQRFVELAGLLERDGWEPVLVVAADALEDWKRAARDEAAVVAPGRLDDVAAYLRASGAAVGNDSGVVHLASNVGLPTVSIFRKRSVSRFWAPPWAPNRVVTAPVRLPGSGGHRFWMHLLRPRRVLHAFRQLTAG